MNKTKFYQQFLALTVFLLPLLHAPVANEFYEFIKANFLYFFGGLLIAIYVTELVLKNAKFPNIPVYIKLYLLSFVISTIFSAHVYTSVWGYYTRFNDGLILTLVLFGIYAVAKEKLVKLDFDLLFKFAVFSLIPVSIYAIYQHATMGRVYATFGQPNWLAQYLAMLLPFANLLFLIETPVVLWYLISVVGYTALWFTYSLSGILGYAIGLGLLIVKASKSKNAVNKILLLIATFVLVSIINLGVFKLRVLDAWKDITKVTSYTPAAHAQTENIVASTQRNLSDTGFIRTELWPATLKLVFSSPKNVLIGTGPETYPYVFQKFRPKSLNYSSEWNFVFNKPHNYYLEVLSEQGLLGFGTYLLLCWQLLKKLERKYLYGFAAFFVANIFGWPTVAPALLFWLMLASLEAKDA